jgi:L-amino acid N-acyltransferase YncA
MIRTARDIDAKAIQAIYAPWVVESAITFETDLPSVDAMRERVNARLTHYPWLVWEENGEVLAYAYACRFRDRAAYDWMAETSIYVHHDAQRRGIARELYRVLLEVLRLQGIVQAVGVITLPGAVSIALHEAAGFAAAGVWHRCGYKLGKWWDVGMWQKSLQPLSTPPPPMIPFAELATSENLLKLLA